MSALPKGVSAEINDLIDLMGRYYCEHDCFFSGHKTPSELPMDLGDSELLVLTKDQVMDIQEIYSNETYLNKSLGDTFNKIRDSLLDIQRIYKTKEA